MWWQLSNISITDLNQTAASGKPCAVKQLTIVLWCFCALPWCETLVPQLSVHGMSTSPTGEDKPESMAQMVSSGKAPRPDHVPDLLRQALPSNHWDRMWRQVFHWHCQRSSASKVELGLGQYHPKARPLSLNIDAPNKFQRKTVYIRRNLRQEEPRKAHIAECTILAALSLSQTQKITKKKTKPI